MIRLSHLPFVLCALAITPLLHAAERGVPKVEVTAVRSAEDKTIAVSIKISRTDDKGVTTTLSQPRLIINEGKRGQVIIGSVRADDRGKATDETESGIRIDVVCPVGTDDLITVATLSEVGDVVWAQATTTKVKPAPDAK